MSSVWLKVLTVIDYRNKVLQSRSSTIDVEVRNLESMMKDLVNLRNNWDAILSKCKLVAENIGLPASFSAKRRKIRKRFAGDTQGEEMADLSPENQYKIKVFYVLLDCIIGNMIRRFEAVKELESNLRVLRKYPVMSVERVKKRARYLWIKYNVYVSEDIVEELQHLKSIHSANLEEDLIPFVLLTNLHSVNLNALFPNVCIALRIICTLPVTRGLLEQNALSLL